MGLRHLFAVALLVFGSNLCRVDPAQALLDIPTSDRQAYDIAELASCSGVSMPVDTAVLPIGEAAYLRAFSALKRRGLSDPTGERLLQAADTRRERQLQWETLVPRWDLRTYYLDSEAGQRNLYHSNGDTLEDGLNTFLAASGSASWDTWLGAAYELQVQQSPDDFDYRTKRLYVKATWGKWSFKLGRDAERLGPGYHGSLLLDDTADTMNLWRIRTEEPLFLPGSLSSLGGFRITLFNGFLSDDNPHPADPRYGSGVDPVSNPNLLGTRLSYHPTSWLDLGLTRTVMYGGDGRASYGVGDYWDLLTGRNENVESGEDHKFDNDQYGAMDITVRLPALNGVGPLKGGKVYWEYAGTDIIARWQGDNPGGLMPFELNHVANLGGLYLTTAVTEFRLEYADTSAPFYRHGQYSQGYTYRGVPLGHHMGGDATNWFFQFARHFGPEWKATVELDLEERRRDGQKDEKRSELTLRVDARQLELLGHPFEASCDLLLANVDDPLDDPDRSDRSEIALGIGLRTEF